VDDPSSPEGPGVTARSSILLNQLYSRRGGGVVVGCFFVWGMPGRLNRGKKNKPWLWPWENYHHYFTQGTLSTFSIHSV